MENIFLKFSSHTNFIFALIEFQFVKEYPNEIRHGITNKAIYNNSAGTRNPLLYIFFRYINAPFRREARVEPGGCCFFLQTTSRLIVTVHPLQVHTVTIDLLIHYLQSYQTSVPCPHQSFPALPSVSCRPYKGPDMPFLHYRHYRMG